MVLFKYIIKPSALDGLGVFTQEHIKKGAVLFKASPSLDIELTQKQFDKLADCEKNEFIHYGYLDKRTKTYKIDFDVPLRFLNYSKKGNICQDSNQVGTYLIANRNIKAGEEVTFNYFEVMDDEHFKKGFNL